ncbi:MAG: xanthine dehydrogenase small subunit [Rhizobiales bacterium]|nr:xanthine dehydrogenase small subunit [Hyphomicrobiales bacterium]
MASGDRTAEIAFILNGVPVTISGVCPTTTLLEWLRYQRRLTGTKEGCAEGDCGACTVVLGDLRADGMHYKAVNACIQFLPMIHGRAVVTVEGLAGPDGTLHPCQEAIASYHGSQCGFCTPGFVMSLYAAFANGEAMYDDDVVDDLLAGNLCRCTGYGPIVAAAKTLGSLAAPEWDEERREGEAAFLGAISRCALDYEYDGRHFHAPRTADGLATLYAAHPEAIIVAGATDVGLWVTKQHRDLDRIIHVGAVEELKDINSPGDGSLKIGAGASYSDAMDAIAGRHADFGELLCRLGSVQVRNAGTIGGNIANGSPIGDTPPALIALGASVVLRRGNERRALALEDFFIDYGKQDRAPGEFVEAVCIPPANPAARLACYKISKRFDQDISALCGCFYLTIEDGAVAEARIAFGGMAATPKRARNVEEALIGRPWTREIVNGARGKFAADFTPISDMRASADYRLAAACNLLTRYFLESAEPLARTRLAGRGARAA